MKHLPIIAICTLLILLGFLVQWAWSDDDTAKLQAMFSACPDGGTIHLEGRYTFSRPLNWTGKRLIIEADGAKLTWAGSDKTSPLITLGGRSGQLMRGLVVRGLDVEPVTAWVNDGSRNAAIRIQNATYGQFYGLSAARTYTGIEWRGDKGGCHFNTVILGRVYNCHDGVTSVKGGPDGYVIGNTLIGGEITVDEGVTDRLATGDRARLFSCPETGSSWTLVGPVLEAKDGSKVDFLNINSRACMVLNPYFEPPGGTVSLGAKSYGNRLIGGVRDGIKWDDHGQGNKWD